MRSLFPIIVYRLGPLVCGLGLLVASAAAQPERPLRGFEEANEAYGQGQYDQAVEGYRDLLDAGYASGALYHNLGNAYARLDRTGPAIWAYERGRRLRPEDPRLQHNLEYVRQRANLPRRGLPPRGLASLVAGWPPLVLFGLGVLLMCGGALGAVVWASPDRVFVWRRPGVWGTFGAGAVLLVMALGTSYVQDQTRRAVVMEEAAPLRAAPADTAVSDTTLRSGTMVDLRMQRDGWVRVRLGDQTEGWMVARALGEV